MFNYIYTIIYVILTALSVIFIHQAAKTLPPSLTLFVGTLLAILFFHLINIKKLKTIYQKAWEFKWLWLQIMLSISVMWLCTIYAPALALPAIVLLVFFSTSCFLGIISQFIQEKNYYLWISAIGILFCTVFIVVDYVNQGGKSPYWILGILLSVFGGAANFTYSKQSYNLSKKSQLTTTQILAIRFWLVEAFCLILFPHTPLDYFNLYNGIMILSIALISLILPIFFFLKGILKIGAEKSVILCGLIPATGYILQSILFRYHDVILLLLYLATGFFISLPGIVKLFLRRGNTTL